MEKKANRDERGKNRGSGSEHERERRWKGVGDSILQLPTSCYSPDILIKCNKMVRACYGTCCIVQNVLKTPLDTAKHTFVCGKHSLWHKAGRAWWLVLSFNKYQVVIFLIAQLEFWQCVKCYATVHLIFYPRCYYFLFLICLRLAFGRIRCMMQHTETSQTEVGVGVHRHRLLMPLNSYVALQNKNQHSMC